MTRHSPAFRIVTALGAAVISLAAAAANAAPFAYVPSVDNKLSIVDTTINRVVGILPTGNGPTGVAVSPAGHRVYVTNTTDGTMTVVDSLNVRVLSTIPVGTQPVGVQVSPDGRKVAVATFGNPGRTITILDVGANTLSTVPVGLGPVSVAYNGSGSRLYVANYLDRTISVIDTSTNATVATIGVAANPLGVVSNASGSRLYVMHVKDNGNQSLVSIVDTSANRVVTTIALPGDPQWLALNPQETRLYVAIGTTGSVSVIDTGTNQHLIDFIVNAGGFPNGVAVSQDGSRIFVVDSSRNELSTWNASNFALISAVPVGLGASAAGDFLGPEVVSNGADSPGPLSGIWFNPNESGWGINFTQRGNNVFAAWYTYDAAGNPKWYVAPNCSMPAQNSCSGTLYQVTGPAFFGVPFDPSKRNVTAVGSLSVNFAGANAGTMNYTVAGQSRTVAIQRQLFASGAEQQVNYTDLWFNPAEPGWGIAITQQASIMFAAWYVYDNNGNPTWFVVPNCPVKDTGDSCAGDVFQTTGPPLGPTFDPSKVTVIPAGRMVLNFSDPNYGELNYLRDSLFVSKKITRELF